MTRAGKIGAVASGGALVLLAASLTAPPSASANHDDQPWYTRPWSGEGPVQNRTVEWSFHDSMPSTSPNNKRDRTLQAAGAWTSLPQTFMNFVYESGDYGQANFYDLGCNAFFYQQNMVGLGDLEPGTDEALMETKVCDYPGDDTAFNFPDQGQQ